MDSPSLEAFRSCLDMVLGSQVSVALLEQRGWTRWLPEVPSQLRHSVSLWFLSCFLSVVLASGFPVLLANVTLRDRSGSAALQEQALCLQLWSRIMLGVAFHGPHFRGNYQGWCLCRVRGGILFSHKQWESVLQDNHKWLFIFPAVPKQLTSHAVSPGVHAHTPPTFCGGLHPLPPLQLFPPITLITQPFTWPFPVNMMPLTGKGQPHFFVCFLFICWVGLFFPFQFCFAGVSYMQAVVLLWLRALRWWVESAKWGNQSLEWQETGRV